MGTLKIFLFAIFCSFFLQGTAQISFYKKYSAGPFNTGNGVTQLPDSSYAVTGSSGGFDEDSGQAYLMIVDSLGNQKWTKDYGGFASDVGVRVMHVPSDGFYIAGFSNSTSGGDLDFVLYKTNETGELLWEKYYGGSNWERLYDAKLLSDGGLILVGETEGETTVGKDIFMVRTDESGDTLWTKTIQTPVDDVAYAVDTLSDTTFVVGGDRGEFGIAKGMINCFKNDGTEEWLEYYDQTTITTVRDLFVTDDYIYASGGAYNSSIAGFDKWLLRTNKDGDFVNQAIEPYDGSSIFEVLAVKSDGNVYAGLESAASDVNPYPGGNDVFVIKYYPGLYYNGYSQGFSGYDPDYINEMIATSDGGIAFVGTSSDKKQEPSIGTDVVLVKIGPNDETTTMANTGNDLVSLEEEKLKTIRIYPNPVIDYVNIPQKLLGGTYKIYDPSGRSIDKGQTTKEISMNDMRSGFYFIYLRKEGNMYKSKLVKQ